MMPQAYKLRYVRHALSGSNAEDNSGVHTLDPVLTTNEVEERWFQEGRLSQNKLGMGRAYVERETKKRFEQYKDQSTVFIVSPLARALQTFFIAVPEQTLRNAKIVIEPLIMEQTRWFSDRARPIVMIKEIISQELGRRAFSPPLRVEDLNIDWSKMLYNRDEHGSLVGPLEKEAEETLGKPWHLKTGFWHPRNLVERGEKAVRAILEECRKVDQAGRYTDFTICVFGHGGFVNYMVEEIGNIDVSSRPPKLSDWATGEIREYLIQDDNSSRSPRSGLMAETDESRVARHKKVASTRAGFNGVEEARKRYQLQDFIASMRYYEDHQGSASLEALYKRADAEGRNPSSITTSEQ
jgi:hypothetical protein